MKKLKLAILTGAILLTAFTAPNQDENGFTGYAVASVTPDSIVANGFGLANKERSIDYTKYTVQPVGSVSKTLIGVALMIAKDQGIIDLDTDINTYLDFEVKNPHIKSDNRITLRHLATHTSGIQDTGKFYKLAYTKGNVPEMSIGQYLKKYLIKSGEMYSRRNFGKEPAGASYAYSNVGATLAAYVLEKASGVSFDEFTKTHILEPLGMLQSGWRYQEIDSTKHAILYDKRDNKLQPYTLVTYPDGGFRTSAHDLSIYLQELIKGYNHTSDLLSERSWDELFRKNFKNDKPVKNVGPGEPNSGIFMAYSKSGKIGHTGSDPGVSAVMWFDPETLKGNLFMANEDLTKEHLSQFRAIWEKLN